MGAGIISFVVAVQSLSPVRLFEIPWTAACQAPLFSIISQNLLKFMSIELVMPSNHLILCLCHLFFLASILPSIRVFLKIEIRISSKFPDCVDAVSVGLGFYLFFQYSFNWLHLVLVAACGI